MRVVQAIPAYRFACNSLESSFDEFEFKTRDIEGESKMCPFQ